MAYSNFSFKAIKKQYNLQEETTSLFPNVRLVEPSAWLIETLQRNRSGLGLISEKARSEALVAPILIELHQNNIEHLSIFSGANLEADVSNGLNGECDFILSRTPHLITVGSPIFCMVEAKKEDIYGALGQCTAQMVGARIFNQQDEQRIDDIYGCITIGTEWQFLKLSEHKILIDTSTYFIDNLPKLLGVLQTVVDAYN